MPQRIKVLDGYQAVCAAGVGGFDDYLSVDLLPSEFPDCPHFGNPNVARDSIKAPITLQWTDAGVVYRLRTVCTGWTDTPDKRLYIDTMYGGGTVGSTEVFSAPNTATQYLLQSAQRIEQTIDSGVSVIAVELGVVNDISVQAAGTINFTGPAPTSGAVFDTGQEDIYSTYGRTVLKLTDYNADQPALSFGLLPTGLAVVWESGAPAFTSGKTRLLVEIEAGLGWYRLFA